MLEIQQEAPPRASIQLDPHQGEEIRSLIIRSTKMTFNHYLEQVGLQPTNVSNYLSGRNRISLDVLSKLLAGANLILQCQLHIMIQPGESVKSVDCMPQDDLLYLTEQDMLEPECMSTHPNLQPDIPTSFS